MDTSSIRRTHGPTVHYRATYQADSQGIFEWISSEDRLLLTSPTAADYGALAGAGWFHLAAMPMEAHEVGVEAGRAAGVPMSLDPHEEYVTGYEERLRALSEGRRVHAERTRGPTPFSGSRGAGTAPVRLRGGGTSRRLAARRSSPSSSGRSDPSCASMDGRSTCARRWCGSWIQTGAGDAYCGGFIVGSLLSGSAVIAAACGTVAAGETVGIDGGVRRRP